MRTSLLRGQADRALNRLLKGFSGFLACLLGNDSNGQNVPSLQHFVPRYKDLLTPGEQFQYTEVV